MTELPTPDPLFKITGTRKLQFCSGFRLIGIGLSTENP